MLPKLAVKKKYGNPPRYLILTFFFVYEPLFLVLQIKKWGFLNWKDKIVKKTLSTNNKITPS